MFVEFNVHCYSNPLTADTSINDEATEPGAIRGRTDLRAVAFGGLVAMRKGCIAHLLGDPACVGKDTKTRQSYLAPPMGAKPTTRVCSS